MSTTIRVVGCVTALAAVCLGVTCEARAVTEKVAATGDPAPGGLYLGEMFGAPLLNEAGQVAFGCDTRDDEGMVWGSGIFRYDAPGSGIPIVLQGDPAPGGGTFEMLGAYWQNDTGQVAFWTDMPVTGLYRGDGTVITWLVGRGDPAPVPPGGTFDMFDTMTPPSLNGSGQAALAANVMGGTAMSGIFRADGATTTTMALEGDPAPAPGGGTDGLFSTFYTPDVNDLGQAAFQADTMGGMSTGGLFRSDGATVVSIVRQGQAAPWPPGGTFDGMFESVAFNNAAQVAFAANLMGGTSLSGLFRGDGTTLTTLAAESQPIPDGPGTFSMFGGLTFNDAGQVALHASLTGTAQGMDDDEGIYRADGVTIDKIVRKGDPVPEGGGTFGTLGMVDVPRINSGGQVAFIADINDPMGGGPWSGIYLADDREVVLVARTGQALPDGLGPASELNFSGPGGGLMGRPMPVLNDLGQVVYSARGDDGMGGMPVGIFLYTPELHWRAAASGSWDANDNWTVGLEPDYVHPVVIDPSVNVTVTGPAADVEIASLRIAPAPGATAALILNGSGTLEVAGTIAVEDGGTLELLSGTLAAPQLDIDSGGAYTGTGGTLVVDWVRQNGGTVNGTLQNTHLFHYISGAFNGRLLHQGGEVCLEADFTAADGLQNEASLALWDVTVTLNGSGLDNRDAMYLAEVTLAGNGPLVNNGAMICADETLVTIGGTGGFTNNGYLTTAAEGYLPADLTLANSGTNTNQGNIDLATGRRLTLDGADLDNHGTLNVNGAMVQGTGTLNNMPAGCIAGHGIISSGFSNSGLVAAYGGTLRITDPFTNNGVVRLADDAANLTGGTITNAAAIEGHGQVAADVNNTGTIDPTGGTLAMSGAVTNQPGGLIAATAGNKVLVTAGLAPNAGTISLTGGTFDNGGQPLTNNGRIVGYGVLRTGGLANQASVILSGGTATVNGPVTNEATGKIEVAYQPAVFTGDVVNNGEFKVTDTTVTFAGAYTENGVYTSDPADSYFQDVSVGASGAFVGGAGDRFFVRGDLLSSSAAAGTWNTVEADLIFQPSGDRRHTMSVTSEDRGSGAAAWPDNFAWGRVTVGTGETVTLADAGAAGGALYTQRLTLEADAKLDLADLNLRLNTAPANDGTVDLVTGNLIVDYDGASPVADVADQIRSGLRDGPTGYWDGPGITSSAAAADLQRLTAVGVIDNSDSETGIGGLATFAGAPVDETSVLAGYAWFGDANMDGVVDTNDYDRINTNWLLWTAEGTVPDGGFRWAVGDFNYDGTLDTNDYDKINNAWLLSKGAVLGGGTPAATPEPATLALLAVGGLMLVRRRTA